MTKKIKGYSHRKKRRNKLRFIPRRKVKSMKPEPLKGKGGLVHSRDFHFDDDIRSAVEYLKQEIKAITFDHIDKHKECDLTIESVAMDRVLRKIDKAFEDVVKKVKK